MCFSNFHNRFGSMQVFLDFGVYYEGQSQKEEDLKNKEELSRDINNTLTSIVVGNMSFSCTSSMSPNCGCS